MHAICRNEIGHRNSFPTTSRQTSAQAYDRPNSSARSFSRTFIEVRKAELLAHMTKTNHVQWLLCGTAPSEMRIHLAASSIAAGGDKNPCRAANVALRPRRHAGPSFVALTRSNRAESLGQDLLLSSVERVSGGKTFGWNLGRGGEPSPQLGHQALASLARILADYGCVRT